MPDSSGIIKSILDVIGSTAIGAATEGKSVIAEKEMKDRKQEQQQAATRQAILSLMNQVTAQGGDVSKLGITPDVLEGAGMEKNAVGPLLGLYGKVSQGVQGEQKAESEALGKINPKLAGVPGQLAGKLIGPAFSAEEAGARQQTGIAAADRRARETSAAAGEREQDVQKHADARAALARETRLEVARIAHGGTTGALKPEAVAKLQESVDKMYQQMTTGQHETEESKAATFNDMEDIAMTPGLPRDVAIGMAPFQISIKPPTEYFGRYQPANVQHVVKGPIAAFTLGLANPNLEQHFRSDAASVGVLKAATQYVKLGLMDKDVYKQVVARIQDLSNRLPKGAEAGGSPASGF